MLARVLTGTVRQAIPTGGQLTLQSNPARPEFSDALVSVRVGADGRFQLPLPDRHRVSKLLVSFTDALSPDCRVNLNESRPQARHFAVETLLFYPTGSATPVYLLQKRPGAGERLKPGDYAVVYYYADLASSATGTVTCPAYTMTLATHFAAGWNAVVYTVDAVSSTGEVTGFSLRTPRQLPPARF
ncbi:hypothetical protein [Deinococcus ruber]|uniref:Uncharacterized protein n=1 Tax=Deinococcus ruber TaxID=1848197 RepID=A0A918CKV7_9DEIO|nr:hypothetical protein [Deinococcus ruber]GGR27121.1 hypothetical protein GCM10008957_43090 [Deinococcus ruber]